MAIHGSVLNYVDVSCPVCEYGDVRCYRGDGDPEVGISAGVEDFEASCACSSSALVDQDGYRARLDELTHDLWLD